MNDSNQIWKFFASVKLALFTLSTISLTSIIGTVIPQDQPFDFYVERYGAAMARFFQVLDIPEMYGSWWFLALLGLLCANLIICSIDRFPFAWKQITADQTAISAAKLEKMAFTHTVRHAPQEAGEHLESLLRIRGWNISRMDTADGRLIAAQKGAWSRMGVYIVHLSILIIFAGAIVGHFFGFKGSVLIPETKQTDKIYAAGTQLPIDLGFSVRCDMFAIEFYDNNMPKDYRSRLAVIENGKEVLATEIEVNHPLKYRGITFYQSSYEGYRDFLITFTNPADGSHKSFVVPFQQQVNWPGKDIVMGIVNAEAIQDRVVRMKVWLKSGNTPPMTFWLDTQTEASTEQSGLSYTVKVKQMYATGLQVAKDPGVWLVYLGCLLMLFGLVVAFFTSHRRVWIATGWAGEKDALLLAGTTNKNTLGFEKTFTELIKTISRTDH